MPFNLLLIGGGGREHALAWKLAQSHRVEHIFVSPGNGGTQLEQGKIVNISEDLSADRSKLLQFICANSIELVVVGPEQPLVDGISDFCRRNGVPCFGPSQKAAQLEGSKAFSKDFMRRHNIPTAEYQTFTDAQLALQYVQSVFGNNNAKQFKLVVKASGLAAGKGVIIAADLNEAEQAVKSIMQDQTFGTTAGQECVIEEYLDGEECSILAFSDGYTVRLLPASQDHKRAYEGDQGPNTGGMGAYAPAPLASKSILEQVESKVLKPTVDGMRREGMPFVGLLYAGVMVLPGGVIKVLEFNCRFGDPETQVVMPLLSDDTDLVEVMLACVNGCLDSVKISFKNCYAATVVLAAAGYPHAYKKGESISLKLADKTGKDFKVFHAGTKVNADGQLVSCGGRVVSVSGFGKTLQESLDNAYSGVSSVKFAGMQYRKDIAWRALKQLSVAHVDGPHSTYEEAGVSIDRGNLLVEKIKAVTKATKRPGTDAQIGGFGGMFDLKQSGYDAGDTILVSATDGVGTKLKIAQIMDKHDTIGIDLVAMNVNDLIVQGAEPLVFLDYFACGKLEVDVARNVVTGIAEGCKQANCGLVGGETAEMPGLYTGGDYDLAGFTVGAVRRSQVLPLNDTITEGDILIGIASSGVHSNGYSLVRYLIAKNGFDYHAQCPFDSTRKLGEALLEPTRIYIRSLLPIVRQMKIKAMSHITGGGFIDNIPRVLPDHIDVEMDATTWPLLPVFKWLKSIGNLSAFEMSRTFNCGIGMVLVVSVADVELVMAELKNNGEMHAYRIGHLVKRKTSGERVQVLNAEQAWS